MTFNDYNDAILAAQTICAVSQVTDRIGADAILPTAEKLQLIWIAERRQEEIVEFYLGRPLKPTT